MPLLPDGPSGDLALSLEGALFSPDLSLSQAWALLSRWHSLGVRRAAAAPNLIQALAPKAPEGFSWLGLIGHPTGCHTIGTKRMEALECLRMGAAAVEVVLDPAPLRCGDHYLVEKEMAAILSTVHELQASFALDLGGLTPFNRDLFLRVVKAVRPAGLMPWAAPDRPPTIESLREFRARLHKKVAITAPTGLIGREEAMEWLAAGACWIRSASPEALLAPPQ